MQSALFGVLLATCYLVVFVGVMRGLRVWLRWRDARRLQAFRAQCLLAECERIGHRLAAEREWGRAA